MCGIRAYGDVRFGEGYAQGKAERDLAIALSTPLRMGVLSGDITSKIFETVDITPGCKTEFPLDLLAPDEDKEFVPSEYVKETEKEWTAGKEQAWMKKEDIEKAVDMRYMPKNQWEEHYGSAVPTTKMTTRNIPPTSG
jgi:hypothetical protein